jgi:uncharacterized membrane protein YgdD (TMEM256/DUF423 family)
LKVGAMLTCEQKPVNTMTNRTLQKNMFRTGATLMGVAVALGAFGAHGLKSIVSPEDVKTFNTGVQYQFIHSSALLLLALGIRRINESVLQWVNKLFLYGIVAFSGSLYVLSLRSAIVGFQIPSVIGVITPLGGLFFIAGWMLLAWKGYKTFGREYSTPNKTGNNNHSEAA